MDIIFNEFFCKDLDENGIPKQMVRENIYECFGMIQWLFIGQP